MKNKKQQALTSTFQVFNKNADQSRYPLLLCNIILQSKSQFQKTRSTKLLQQWIYEYRQMNQIMKYKYLSFMPRVLKVIVSIFTKKEDAYPCIAPFYFQYYQTWKQLTETIIEGLTNNQVYSLKFLWYLSFNFAEYLDATKQYDLSLFLANNFQKPLRNFAVLDFMNSKPLLQTVRLLNIQSPKQVFINNANEWMVKMQKLLKQCQIQHLKIQTLIQIIGCRSFMIVQTQQSKKKRSEQVLPPKIQQKQKLQLPQNQNSLDQQIKTPKKAQLHNQFKFQYKQQAKRIKKRPYSYVNEQSKKYWLSKVQQFIGEIQKKVQNLSLKNQVDIKLLDGFSIILNFVQVEVVLLENKDRYLQTLLCKMKKSNSPASPFHYQKYYSYRTRLAYLFYFEQPAQTVIKIQEMIINFLRKSYTVLSDMHSQFFLDVVCQKQLVIDKNILLETIKTLANAHMRKNLPVPALLSLVRILNSTSTTVKIPDQSIISIIKSLSESIASKINDPNIYQLRVQISKYYINLAKIYRWQDAKSTQIMLTWCEQFQRNSKFSTEYVPHLLSVLTKKYGNIIMSSFSHKLQNLIFDITLKLKHEKTAAYVPDYISLVLLLFKVINWGRSQHYIQQVSSKDPQKVQYAYSLQAAVLFRNQNTQMKKQQMQVIKTIFSKKQNWAPPNINVYLMYFQLLFWKLSRENSYKLLIFLDEEITSLLTFLYEQIHYNMLIHLAGRIFSNVGQIQKLRKLKSYKYFKQNSFDILSRSFNKQCIVMMTFVYCNILLKSKKYIKLLYLVKLGPIYGRFAKRMQRFYWQREEISNVNLLYNPFLYGGKKFCRHMQELKHSNE